MRPSFSPRSFALITLHVLLSFALPSIPYIACLPLSCNPLLPSILYHRASTRGRAELT